MHGRIVRYVIGTLGLLLSNLLPGASRCGIAIKPSRIAKLHVGGYFDLSDPSLLRKEVLDIALRHAKSKTSVRA